MGGDDAAADASRARASRAKAGGSAGSARMEGGRRMRAEDGRSADMGLPAVCGGGFGRGRLWGGCARQNMHQRCVDAYSTDIISSRDYE
jgi:hypothetical protein